MKTIGLHTETDVKASIMSLFDEMVRLKNDILACKEAIVSHAVEARHSTELMNDTVAELKFSVTGMKANMILMQQSLESLTKLANSLTTIGRFIVVVAKTITWVGGISLAIIGIIQFLK